MMIIAADYVAFCGNVTRLVGCDGHSVNVVLFLAPSHDRLGPRITDKELWPVCDDEAQCAA